MTRELPQSSLRVHLLDCGRVRIKRSQAVGRGRGLVRRARPFLDSEWTDWLPIAAYAIEHREGVFVIDAGANARLMTPAWHPFFHLAVQFDIDREREIGPQLKALGIAASDVKALVLTHLHIDHDGGLGDLPGVETFAAPGEFAAASGWWGELWGCLPRRWPDDFAPKPLTFDPEPFGPFARSKRLTRDGALVAIPTPGHTHHHISVVAETPAGRIVFTGDATYSLASLRADVVDGIAPSDDQARDTLARLRRLAEDGPSLILPAHDPEAAARLAAWGTMI